MGSELEIIPLTRDRGGVRRFLRVPYSIYEGDSNWVAPLLRDQEKTFSDGNPFFEHATMQLWVARRRGRDVGRIAGIVDRLYLKHQEPKGVFFGFFEAEQRREVSERLFETVFDWARRQQFERIMGPVNPSTNDECGLLVEGYDRPPVFMMPYNPPYYVDMLEAAGLAKAKDLVAFYIDVSQSPRDRLDRIRERFRRRHPELVIRPLLRRTFWNDLEKIRQVYNEAWRENWGFVPMTEAEIDFMAERLKPLLVEGLVWIAEAADGPVGFLLAVPDFNEAIQPLQGRLSSPRVLGFLPYLFGWKMPRSARVVVLGVRKGYRLRGVESVMLAEAIDVGWQMGIRASEASWVLEDNLKIRRVIEAMGGKIYKTYRLYERTI